MKLGIIGTGAMGHVLHDYALEEGSFSELYDIEPLRPDTWPAERMDLLIDFSHPAAVRSIYEYCLAQGGGIPVVLATTGYGPEEETLIRLLQRIGPVDRRSNYARGVAVMTELCRQAAGMVGDGCDIRIVEVHHADKRDAPSGTARALGRALGFSPEEESRRISSLRMGTVPGEHTVYFAMADEVLGIRHTALSKRIFAIGALEAGKSMLDMASKGVL